MNYINGFISTLYSTVLDVLPILLLVAFFQVFIIRKPIPDFKKVIAGLIMVILGLEKALFPIGDLMAKQLSSEEFIKKSSSGNINDWTSYYWMYIFSALIGFATTIAEPALKAVAMKASEVSGGVIDELRLRITVAVGASIALTLGVHRIVTGTPLMYYLMASYAIVILQTIFVKKDYVALAYDSGGVTTSTVTVPIVAALGLGISSVVPGSNIMMDGFGMIALVCMFPIITVLGYIQFVDFIVLINKKSVK